MELQVSIGDVATTPGDALVTLVNETGCWWGPIDKLLRARSTKWHQHILLDEGRGAEDGFVHVVSKRDANDDDSPWDYVFFVIDHRKLSLAPLVTHVVQLAERMQLRDIVITAMRMGIMLDSGPAGERDLESKCRAIVRGIYEAPGPFNYLERVKLVVWHGDRNRDQIFPLCNAACVGGIHEFPGRELRCIQL